MLLIDRSKATPLALTLAALLALTAVARADGDAAKQAPAPAQAQAPAPAKKDEKAKDKLHIEASVTPGFVDEDLHPGPLLGGAFQATDGLGRGVYTSAQIGKTDTPINYEKISVLPFAVKLDDKNVLLLGANGRRVQMSDSLVTTVGPEARLNHGTTQYTLKYNYGTYADPGDLMPNSGFSGLEFNMETNNRLLGGNARLGWTVNAIVGDILLPKGVTADGHYFAVIEPGLNWDTGVHIGQIKMYFKPSVQLLLQDAKNVSTPSGPIDADRAALAVNLNLEFKIAK